MLCKRFRDRAAQSADDVVILRRDNRARHFRALAHELRVERLDRRHVDDCRGDAFIREDIGRLKPARDFDTAGDDRHVRALTQHVPLADLEFMRARVDALRRAAAGAHVDRAIEFEHGFGRLTHLFGIGGRNDGHAGNGAKGGDVLQRLCGAAVGTNVDARMARDDFYVAACIGDRKAGLLDGAQAEDGESRDHGHGPVAARPPAIAIMFCSAMPH